MNLPRPLIAMCQSSYIRARLINGSVYRSLSAGLLNTLFSSNVVLLELSQGILPLAPQKGVGHDFSPVTKRQKSPACVRSTIAPLDSKAGQLPSVPDGIAKFAALLKPILYVTKFCQVAGLFFGFQYSCSVVADNPVPKVSSPDLSITGVISLAIPGCRSVAQSLKAKSAKVFIPLSSV